MQMYEKGIFTLKTMALGIVSFMFLALANNAHASLIGELTKGTGRIYLSVTSPVEWFTQNHIIEQQHITPQKYGSDFKDVVLITRINHTVSDRWKDKAYLNEHDNALVKLMTFGNGQSLESLNAAYRLGCYVHPYAIFSYGYGRDTVSLLSTELDAPSMIVYGVSWALNTPQKFVNKIAYIIDAETSVSVLCLVDIIPNILALFLEAPLAIVGTVVGSVIALMFNPFDSLCSFLGMFYFLIMSLFTAVWDLILGLLRLLPFI